jgi:streptomycin 6-kinase
LKSSLPRDYYIDRWQLTPEDDAITTRTSRLLPVRWQGVAAMLKVVVDAEEELAEAPRRTSPAQ